MVDVERLVVIGGGGHGREVLDVVADVNRRAATWDLVGVVDDDPGEDLLASVGVRHLGPTSALADLAGAAFLVGVGDPAARRRLADAATAAGLHPARAALHPTATVGSLARVGAGVVSWPHAAVTTNVTLGDHVHLNQHVTVGHDTVLGDFVTVNPGANLSGGVRLGDGVLVGAGAVVLQYLRVGEGTVIGAGAVVTADLPPDVVAVGVPARVRRAD